METDYASNSHKSKAAIVPTNNDPEKKKVTKPVAKAVKTKKAPGRTLVESFVTDDLPAVKDYLIFDVLIPATKNAISDLVTTGIEMILFGESTHRRSGSRTSTNQKVSYSNYYRTSNNGLPSRSIVSSKERYSYDDVVLGTRGEAEDVLGHMFDILDEYEMVSIADLYDLVGIQSSYTDNKYGWTDLTGARVERTREGYYIHLPRTKVLN